MLRVSGVDENASASSADLDESDPEPTDADSPGGAESWDDWHRSDDDETDGDDTGVQLSSLGNSRLKDREEQEEQEQEQELPAKDAARLDLFRKSSSSSSESFRLQEQKPPPQPFGASESRSEDLSLEGVNSSEDMTPELPVGSTGSKPVLKPLPKPQEKQADDLFAVSHN